MVGEQPGCRASLGAPSIPCSPRWQHWAAAWRFAEWLWWDLLRRVGGDRHRRRQMAAVEGVVEVRKFVCYLCKRKFPNASALARHERMSDSHRRVLEKREDKMKKRKRELILAARTVRQLICEREEELQSQVVINEVAHTQRTVLQMKLQQLLREYGMAQEVIEACRQTREAKEAGLERAPRSRATRVGKLELSAGAASWQSNKEVQEDRYILDLEVESTEGHLIAGFAVLDGHSGSLCVDHVVEWLQTHLQRCLSAKPRLTDENLQQAVHEACLACDEEFLKKARQVEVLDGTTLVLALVYPQTEPPTDPSKNLSPGCCRMLVACVGDSRAVLCRTCDAPGAPDGGQQLVAVPLSEDHKPNRPDEQRRIEAKGGVVDFEGVWRVFIPGSASFGGQLIARWGLAVSRSFGDLLLKEPERHECAGVSPGGLISAVPEMRAVDIAPGVDRFLLLASDGVWDVIGNEDAVAICAAHKTPEEAAQMLLRRTYAANSDDNITALVLAWRSVG